MNGRFGGAKLTFEPISAEIRTTLWLAHWVHSENAHSSAENCPDFGPKKRPELSAFRSLYERSICLSPLKRQLSLPEPEIIGSIRTRWCCWRGLNSRPLPYQGSALPLSYSSTGFCLCHARSGRSSRLGPAGPQFLGNGASHKNVAMQHKFGYTIFVIFRALIGVRSASRC
jgi:hypothetical protein